MIRPPRYVTIDGYPVSVSQLETSSVANLGYDQFRAVVSHSQLSHLPWTTGLGSVVTVYDGTEQITWQGRLSEVPRVQADETVRLAAQGHGYQAVKSVRRLPIKVRSVKGWTVGNTSPLDITQTASAEPTVSYVKTSGHLVENQVTLAYTSATEVSMAFYAPGAEIRRLTWSQAAATAGYSTLQVLGSRGPSSFEAHMVLISDMDSGSGYIEIPPNDFDTIVVRVQYASPTSGEIDLKNPVVWGRKVPGSLTSDEIARAVGDMLDWDVTLVENVGEIEFPSFDWAGDVASGLSEAAAPDDFRWLVLDDRGGGPVLDFGPWERTWEVSAYSGASWDLDPLERYTKVVVQYVDDLGKARAFTVESTGDFLVANELQTVAGGLQSVDEPGTLPEQMAANILEFATSERWRGSISTPRVVELGTGLTDRYRVRAGDLVRITDFDTTHGEALTLRIAEVNQTDDGIQMGIEAPAFAAGSLDAGGGGISSGTFIQIDPDAYAPSGAPTSTVPSGSGFITGGGYGPPTKYKTPPNPF